MSDKRYLGNIITDTPTAPAGPYQDSAASGVWSLAEAFAYTKAGLWPTAGNALVQALFAGGGSSGSNVIQSIGIATTGNAIDFGDLPVLRQRMAACGSSVTAHFMGGATNSPVASMYSVNFGSGGNATYFGELTLAREYPAAMSNSTRGVIGGGNFGSTEYNTIDYITLSSLGGAADFGDLSQGVCTGMGASGSATRGLFGGGGDNNLNARRQITYVTIASTGNSVTFGELIATPGTGTGRRYLCAFSSTTRSVFSGGWSNSAVNVLDYVTTASTGNATDFGDLTIARDYVAGASSDTRGVTGGGTTSGSNVIDYVTIASAGNAIDFGDLLSSENDLAACSNVHGGIAA